MFFCRNPTVPEKIIDIPNKKSKFQITKSKFQIEKSKLQIKSKFQKRKKNIFQQEKPNEIQNIRIKNLYFNKKSKCQQKIEIRTKIGNFKFLH